MITAVDTLDADPPMDAKLWFGDAGPIDVSGAWMAKHEPQVGGYYVVYEDGYTSFSPADAFEKGYTKIEVAT